MGTDWPPMTIIKRITNMPIITNAAEAYWTAGMRRVRGCASRIKGRIAPKKSSIPKNQRAY